MRQPVHKGVELPPVAAWETETNFQQRAASDPRITKFLNGAALQHTFDLNRQLRYVVLR